MEKNIYILDLCGHWDPKNKCANGAGMFDGTFDDKCNWIPAKKPVRFHVPTRWHLKRNTGKRNSIERPFVYIDVSYPSTCSAQQKYFNRFNYLMQDLSTIDLSNVDHIEDNAEAYCKLVIPENLYSVIGNILKTHGLENVYTQIRGTKHYSSYTPADIENSFKRLV